MATTPQPFAEPLDDASFVARLRSGDDDAFETLLRRYGGRLFRVARRLLRSEEDARDAVQDAFLSAFKSIEQFEANARLSTWLHRIVVNSCLMRLRAQRRRPEEDLEDLLPRFGEDGHQVEPTVDWSMSAEEMLQRADMRNLVRDLIQQLPDRYRVVLIMRDVEEISTQETAAALGITPNAAKVRLHRARQALRTLLDRHLKERERR